MKVKAPALALAMTLAAVAGFGAMVAVVNWADARHEREYAAENRPVSAEEIAKALAPMGKAEREATKRLIAGELEAGPLSKSALDWAVKWGPIHAQKTASAEAQKSAL